MFDINGAFSAELRNGIFVGIIFSVVSIVVFWRTLTSFAKSPMIIGFQPFFVRFLLGVGVGIVLVALGLFAIRYALTQHVG
jgi:hypothetical protein